MKPSAIPPQASNESSSNSQTDEALLVSANSISEKISEARTLDSILNDSFPSRGVSFPFLDKWLRTQLEKGKIPEHATTTEVSNLVIRPATLGKSCSYVELILQQPDSTITTEINEATHFVSHAWKYRFMDLVASLEIHYNSLDVNDRQKTYYWVDLFIVDQHNATTYPHNWWSTTFVNAIRSFGKVVMVFQPFLSPIPLTRAWCLWEIFASIKSNANIDLTMTIEQYLEFRKSLKENVDAVIEAITCIDGRKAEAYNPHDKEAIFKTIEEEVGFEEFNKVVANKIAGITLCATIRESFKDNSLDRVHKLLSFGADINTVASGLNPLGSACDFGHTELVKVLLSQGANVNSTMCWNHTPLHLACGAGRPEICHILLENGARYDIINSFDRTPADEARFVLNNFQICKSRYTSGLDNILSAEISNGEQVQVEKQKEILTMEQTKVLNLILAEFETVHISLNSLTKNDLAEVKSFCVPPKTFESIVKSTLILLQKKPFVKQLEDIHYWKHAKQVLFSNLMALNVLESTIDGILSSSHVIPVEDIALAKQTLEPHDFSADNLLNKHKVEKCLYYWCSLTFKVLDFDNNSLPYLAKCIMDRHNTVGAKNMPNSNADEAISESDLNLLKAKEDLENKKARCSECITIIEQYNENKSNVLKANIEI